MKLSLLFAAMLLVASAGGAHALTVQSQDSAGSGAAALVDPDEALQNKYDDSGASRKFSGGSTSSGSGFSFGFSGQSNRDRNGSGFDRMMPWAAQPPSAPSATGAGWR